MGIGIKFKWFGPFFRFDHWGSTLPPASTSFEATVYRGRKSKSSEVDAMSHTRLATYQKNHMIWPNGNWKLKRPEAEKLVKSNK